MKQKTPHPRSFLLATGMQTCLVLATSFRTGRDTGPAPGSPLTVGPMPPAHRPRAVRLWPEAHPSQDHVLHSESILEMKTKPRVVLQAPQEAGHPPVTEGGGSVQVPWSPGTRVLLGRLGWRLDLPVYRAPGACDASKGGGPAGRDGQWRRCPRAGGGARAGGPTWYGCLCSQCPAADCPEELTPEKGVPG